jgi:SPP1 gp7 family putative phage head morphogenesis protein
LSNYWAERQEQKLVEFELETKEAQKQIVEILKQAKKNIDRQVNEVYMTYSNKTGLAVDELSQILSGSEKANFYLAIQRKMQELGMNYEDVYHEGYLARLKRLDALREQIYWEMVTLAPKEVQIMEETFTKIARNAYQTTGQELARFKGISPSFAVIDTGVVRQVISRNWFGSNFSDRIWTNTEALANRLAGTLGSALSMGQSYSRTANDLRADFRVARYEAVRLVRTESAFIYGQSDIEAYKDAGIEWYQYDAVMENTCEVCMGLHGDTFRVEDQVVGENFPPMHPNCRCTTFPLFEGEKIYKRERVEVQKKPEETKTIDTEKGELDFITARPDRNSRHIYYFTKDTTNAEITEELGNKWVSVFRDNN